MTYRTEICKIAIVAFLFFCSSINTCQAAIYKGTSLYIEKPGVEGVDAEVFALEDAKREAIESNLILISSNTLIKDMRVGRDEIKTFARGVAKLLPNSITKTTHKIVDGEKIIKIVADFDVDENLVKRSIENYINNRNTIMEFTDIFDKYDSVNLKRQYIINKKLAYLNTDNVDFTKEEKARLHAYLIANLNGEVAGEVVGDFIKEANWHYKRGLYFKSNFYIDEMIWIIDHYNRFEEPMAVKAKYLVKKAENYSAMNMREEAKEILIKATNIYPKYVRSWKLLVEYASDKAEKDYYMSKVFDEERVAGLLAESDSYFRKALFAKALASINEAIELEILADNIEDGIRERLCTLYQRQGCIYNILNNNAKALQSFQMAIDCNKYDSYVYLSRGCLYEKLAQYDNAMNDFDSIINNINAGKSNRLCLDAAYYNKGVIYSHKGDYINALKYIDLALKVNPGLAMAYTVRSEIEGKMKK